MIDCDDKSAITKKLMESCRWIFGESDLHLGGIESGTEGGT